MALALRGHPPTPDLALVEAASLHQLGRDGDAMDAALPATKAPDAELAERATYVLGLAADARGNVQTLSAACDGLRRLQGKPSAARQADTDELAARLALRRGDQRAAEQAALAASAERQTLLDYRGMRVALELAARAAQRDGDTMRADAYAQQAAQSLASDCPIGSVEGQGLCPWTPLRTGP